MNDIWILVAIALAILLTTLLIVIISFLYKGRKGTKNTGRLIEKVLENVVNLQHSQQSDRDEISHIALQLSQLDHSINPELARVQESQQTAKDGITRLTTALVQLERVLSTRIGTLGEQATSSLQQIRNELHQALNQIHNESQTTTRESTERLTAAITQMERAIDAKIGSTGETSLTSLQQVRNELHQAIVQYQQETANNFHTLEQNSVVAIHQTYQNLSSEIAQLHQQISALQIGAQERHLLEQKTSESIQRLETIIAGTQSRGVAGENIVNAVFSKLPVEWQVRDFQVNGKTVEFGLRLPNGLVLPIDSKWTSINLLEQFAQIDDEIQRAKLKKEIEKSVMRKAREVKKYINPNVTVLFAVVVLPDAVFDASVAVQPDIFQMGMVVVSYSMFVPYLLLVFHTILKTEHSIDLQKLNVYLQAIEDSLSGMQAELDGRFSRAITMLNNSRNAMHASISKANAGLVNLQLDTNVEKEM